jgi:hypothetical protein
LALKLHSFANSNECHGTKLPIERSIAMPVFIRMRLAAIRLARALRRSILTERKLWEIDSDSMGRPCVMAGPFRIVIAPRAVRLFDALHVYCGRAEVWLPLLWRLRLRNTVRWLLADTALELFKSADLEASGARRRAPRKRTRQEQPA